MSVRLVADASAVTTAQTPPVLRSLALYREEAFAENDGRQKLV